MAKKKNKAGLADRVAGRLDREELRHQSMASGQGVFRGDLATRALEAVGARAMTLDRSIIVGEDFDPGRPADQALYAHERYHAEHGDGQGGGAGQNFRDAEEIAARAVEMLTLNLATSGTANIGQSIIDTSSSAPSDRHAAVTQQAQAETAPSHKSEHKTPNKTDGYAALLDQGFTHDEIVTKLTQAVLKALQEEFSARGHRGGLLKGSF